VTELEARGSRNAAGTSAEERPGTGEEDGKSAENCTRIISGKETVDIVVDTAE
jgi:hypothetical protein